MRTAPPLPAWRLDAYGFSTRRPRKIIMRASTNTRQPKTDMHPTELLFYGLLAVLALVAVAIFNHRQRKARERAEQEAERLAFKEFERQQEERRQRIQRLVAQFDDV